MMAPSERCGSLRQLVIVGLIGLLAMVSPSASQPPPPVPAVRTGAEALVSSGFAVLAGKRVGLIANQTSRVGDAHLADLLHQASNVRLAAILAPEHGFRGAVEAGEKVADGIDERTGVPVHSLYGATRKPTPAMLANLDVLVFDIQDIGVRFYTYISTMGLAMQAAAERGIPFLVLDRPNPLGGTYVSGFMREAGLNSFVGQYPIPIVHGMTVGELARMIKGERWLEGLETLELSVVEMRGWRRAMRWPELKRAFVATSPNIPTFASALLYPGIGIVGETAVNEGRGTGAPFTLFGAPWIDAKGMARHLNALRLAGVRFEAASVTPRSIPGIAAKPRYVDRPIEAVRITVEDVDRVAPLEIGMHALAAVVAEARAKGIKRLFPNRRMFDLIAGTKRLHRMLATGKDGAAIIASWQSEVARFEQLRARYIIYR